MAGTKAREQAPRQGLPRHGVARRASSWALTVVGVLAMLASMLTLITGTAKDASAGPPAAMFGYVPLPSDELQTVFETLNAAAGSTLDFTVGITTASQGGIVYYDHWEGSGGDIGYEADIDTPTQPSTEVWGDGNPANGDASTVCTTCAGDVLTAGDVFVLRNDITTPRDPTQFRWDGRDKVASTRGFAMTAGGWTTSIGSVLAGVVSAFDTTRYGTSFVVPVGQDTPFPAGSSPPFEYTGATIMAANDNTNVQIDADNNGSFESSQNINGGGTMFVNGGLNEGARIQSDRPVQVHLLTGDIGATYEGHFFTLVPTALLTNNYINPVGSGAVNQETVIYLYNPNASPITVTPTCASCVGTINVPGETSASFVTPLGEGVRFESGGPVFTAVGAMGSQSGSGGQTDSTSVYDWGFSLVPADILTTQVVLGWAPGASDLPPSSAAYDPVWVTTFADTTLSIDFDADPTTGSLSGDCIGQHDLEIPVTALASTRITDTGDNSMTGARIYTCDGAAVAAAWGEDPTTAPTGSPGLDAGYTVIPTATVLVNKTSTLFTDTHGDGRLGPGDTIQYEALVSNAGGIQFTNVVIDDTLPAGLQYVPGSTVFDDGNTITPVADDLVPPNATPYPLDEAGLAAPNIDPGEALFVRFRAILENPWTQGTSIVNTVDVDSDQGGGTSTVIDPLAVADVSLTKTESSNPQFLGQNAVFDITVSNAGPHLAPDVVVEDLLPAGLTYQSHVASVGTYVPGTGVWTIGDMTNGQSRTLSITARVDTSDPVTNIAEVTASGAADPDSEPDNGNPAEDDQDSAGVDVAPLADLSLNKVRLAGPSPTGDITYRITLTNAGPSNATGVAVTELPPGAAAFVSASTVTGTFDEPSGVWTVGTLNSGASATLDITWNIPLDQFPATNYAQVTAVVESDPDSAPGEDPLGPGTPPNQDDESSVTVTLSADLSLTKTESNNPQFVGDDAVFDLVISNAGPDPANDVQVTDLLPIGLVHQSHLASDGTYVPLTGVWSIPVLASGGSATLSITARVLTPGTIDNVAEVTASGAPDPDSTPNNQNPAEDDQDTASITTTGGSLGDTIYFDVDGDGTQDAGDPGLAGVNVTVIDAGPNGTLGDGDDVMLPTVTTDPSGNWTVTGLGAGDYRVNVSSGTLPVGLDVPTADPDGIGTANTTVVTLAGGQTLDTVDFGYTGSATVGDAIYLDFDGDALPSAGEGIAGVDVTITWAGFDDTFGTADDQVYSATSNSDGVWSVAGIPAGIIEVDIDETGLPPGVSNSVDPDGGNDGTSVVTIGAGATDLDQDFGYLGLGGLGHLVFRDDNASGAFETGEGLVGVSVDVTWAGPSDTFGDADDHTTTAITDANGDWAAGNLPGGSYRVLVVEATLPAGSTNTVDPDGGNDSTSAVTLLVAETNLLQNFGYVVPAEATAAAAPLPVTGSTMLGHLVLAGVGLSVAGLGLVLGVRPGFVRRLRRVLPG